MFSKTVKFLVMAFFLLGNFFLVSTSLADVDSYFNPRKNSEHSK